MFKTEPLETLGRSDRKIQTQPIGHIGNQLCKNSIMLILILEFLSRDKTVSKQLNVIKLSQNHDRPCAMKRVISLCRAASLRFSVNHRKLLVVSYCTMNKQNHQKRNH
jgi:hypothetical protein